MRYVLSTKPEHEPECMRRSQLYAGRKNEEKTPRFFIFPFNPRGSGFRYRYSVRHGFLVRVQARPPLAYLCGWIDGWTDGFALKPIPDTHPTALPKATALSSVVSSDRDALFKTQVACVRVLFIQVSEG